MATEDLAITLGTLSGDSIIRFSLPSKASVLEGKSWLAEGLGRPAELQRWLVDGAILEDGKLLGSYQASESHAPLQVLCVFLPRTFEVKVKVVKFSPGSQAQSAAEVSISVSPMMTVDAAKFEALEAAAASLGFDSVEANTAARLIKGGLHLNDDRTIEYYHIDPEATLHLIIPRGRPGNSGLPDSAADSASSDCNIDDESSLQAETFHKFSSKVSNSDEIIKNSSVEEKDKDILSPRTKEAASMFTTMGVHRLRPRRSSSMPVFKPRTMHESHQEPQKAINASIQAQMECDGSYEVAHMHSNLSMPVDVHKGNVVDEVAGSEASTTAPSSPCASESEPETPTLACQPQMPSQPRVAPARPPRNRPSSRSNRRPSAAAAAPNLGFSPTARLAQSSLGLTRPPKPTVGSMRPPTMPRPATPALDVELQRPSSRGQHSANASSPRPVSRAVQSERSAHASWVADWTDQAAAAPTGGCALLERTSMRRSSSCRAGGIDRWHFLTRQH